jgi:hypothetical protein
MTFTLALALDDHALQQLLDEDVRFGDLTTESLGIQARPGGSPSVPPSAAPDDHEDQRAQPVHRQGVGLATQ